MREEEEILARIAEARSNAREMRATWGDKKFPVRMDSIYEQEAILLEWVLNAKDGD